MKIPDELKRGSKKKMTISKTLLGKKLLEAGNSERFVAKKLGVSRHALRMACKPDFREYFKKNFKSYEYKKTHGGLESERKIALERYHLLSKLYPEEMKIYRKKKRNAMGKEYFKNYMKKYRQIINFHVS